MIPIPPGVLFNAPVSEEEWNHLQGYWSYNQIVMHNNLTVIGKALKVTSLGTWVHPSSPPAWHFGPPRGQYYTLLAATTHHEESGHADATGGDMDDDHEDEEGHDEME
ncbi:hypothetical protein ACH5RR_036757 [Cinchona calisaya]|uniref:Uncharacterized protein n=1 Tax=Cinchona calisaya TaxID=153742 RepID=A0ABD2Y9K4_9GENT